MLQWLLFKTNENKNIISYEVTANGSILILFDRKSVNKKKGRYVYDDKGGFGDPFNTTPYETPLDNKIYLWNFTDNDHVKENDCLFVLRKEGNCGYKEKTGEIEIVFAYAPREGVLEIIKKEGDILQDKELICRVHPITSQNDPDKKPFLPVHFHKYQIPHNLLFEYKTYGKQFINLHEWLVENGDFVKKDQQIGKYRAGDIHTTQFFYPIKAKASGFINIIKTDTSNLNNELDHGELIYCLSENSSIAIKKIYYNEPRILVDKFTNKKNITWRVVGGNLKPFGQNASLGAIILKSNNTSNLIFTFENLEGKDFLVFYFFKNEYKLSKGDSISFLFEEDQILSFEVVNESVESGLSWKGLQKNKILITHNELQVFANKKMISWKISFPDSEFYLAGECNNVDYYNFNVCPQVVQNLANDYLEVVKTEVEDYQPVLTRPKRTVSEAPQQECFVYLMVDTVNSYHKIGISNSPKYRESTLQSEKPSVELLVAKKFPTRQIAESIEKALHQSYGSKRLRGEWFDLSEKDVLDIQVTLT